MTGLGALTVLRTGPQALIEDLGRPGNAHLGVPPSGALDRPALRLANRLVGNAESAAGVELLLGGLRVRAETSCTVAVTGAGTPVHVHGADGRAARAVGTHQPVYLGVGDELDIGVPASGLRCYLGVRGGIAVPAELGSRSTDVLSGIGPPPVRAGDVLPIGVADGLPAGADELAPDEVPDQLAIPVLLGPRDDWFDSAAIQLSRARWTVSPDSNRVGLRLTGATLRRSAAYQDRELASEAVVTGAVQIPAGGRAVVFLADHPTTGGYPVIGVVPAGGVAVLAQARPGTRVRFVVAARG